MGGIDCEYVFVGLVWFSLVLFSHMSIPSDAFVLNCSAKVTDEKMASQLSSSAICGPTTSNGIPAFNWSKSGLTDPHNGEPNVFDFKWVSMEPRKIET
jgi:hypothetical protein